MQIVANGFANAALCLLLADRGSSRGPPRIQECLRAGLQVSLAAAAVDKLFQSETFLPLHGIYWEHQHSFSLLVFRQALQGRPWVSPHDQQLLLVPSPPRTPNPLIPVDLVELGPCERCHLQARALLRAPWRTCRGCTTGHPC